MSIVDQSVESLTITQPIKFLGRVSSSPERFGVETGRDQSPQQRTTSKDTMVFCDSVFSRLEE